MIIADESKLQEFINWLPELNRGETYYCCLFARNKYCKELKGSDKQQLKRFTTTKEFMVEKIKQLEIPIGYTQRGIEIPNEALAMYIMPNPRSQEKSAKALLKTLADKITNEYDGYNVHQLALTELQKSPSRKVFMDFDFDNVTWEDLKELVLSTVNKEAIAIVHTRGGFHLLVVVDKINEEFQKSWYQKITKLSPDVRGDNLLPLVGCYQGGFIPRLELL